MAEQSVSVSNDPRYVRPSDVAQRLADAEKVAIVPGHGMAVAQAQREIKALSHQLTSAGVPVNTLFTP